MSKKQLVILLVFLCTALFFQNCGKFDNTTFKPNASPLNDDSSDELRTFTASSGLTNSMTFKNIVVNARYGLFPNSLYSEPLRELYSPERFGGALYLAGWKTESDRTTLVRGIPGADRVYRSVEIGSGANVTLSEPQPIVWTNEEYSNGTNPNYHINDVTIISPLTTGITDRSGWLYMYFTCLPSEYYAAPENAQRNLVCWASSTDNGQSWHFNGELIQQNNGLIELEGIGRGTGAWSPSVIIDGEELWLYYHTGNYDFIANRPDPKGTRVLRTRLDMNGWAKIDTIEVKSQGLSIPALNVDVEKHNGKYFMAGDNYSLERALQDIHMWHSNDGISWLPILNNGDSRIIDAKDFSLITPEIGQFRETSDSLFLEITFSLRGLDLPIELCPTSWRYPTRPDLHCKQSQIHRWTMQLEKN